MINYEGIIDMDTKIPMPEYTNIDMGIIDEIVFKLNSTEDKKVLTKMYTDILNDENILNIFLKITKEQFFAKHFPEFYIENKYGENVINCIQNSIYHKYGVFRHIISTIEEVGKYSMSIGEYERKILKWTMLLHDIGKPAVKNINDERESFNGHDEKSYELSINILDRFYFTDEEKRIILTLVRYHDKFLNEGEITYDNMKLLAEKLDNKRELFYLLIEVKDADAKSKSIEVYNKYKVTKNKYLDFANSYFENIEQNSDTNINANSIEIGNLELKRKELTVEDDEFDSVLDNIINKKGIITLYQPVIDIENMIIHGYEVFTKIDYSKEINTEDILKYAFKANKIDKIEQILFLNGIQEYIENKKDNTNLFVNINLNSYESYINKPRIYDYMNKINLVIEFTGYEKYDISELQNKINLIHSKEGKVLLNHFGIGTYLVEDIEKLNIDYLKLDRTMLKDIVTNLDKQKLISELVTLCLSKNISFMVVGIENKEMFMTLKKLGVKYMQGFYLARPQTEINLINDDIKTAINQNDEGLIN